MSAKFLETAGRIGARPCRDAIWAGGRCNWIGGYTESASIMVHRALTPEVCSGTSGIALLLFRLFEATGEKIFRMTAEGALQQALSKEDELRAARRFGFLDGLSGIACVAATEQARTSICGSPTRRGSLSRGLDEGCDIRPVPIDDPRIVDLFGHRALVAILHVDAENRHLGIPDAFHFPLDSGAVPGLLANQDNGCVAFEGPAAARGFPPRYPRLLGRHVREFDGEFGAFGLVDHQVAILIVLFGVRQEDANHLSGHSRFRCIKFLTKGWGERSGAARKCGCPRNQFEALEYKQYKESSMKVLMVSLLLLAPAFASSDWSRFEGRRARAEARRDRMEALRETRRARVESRRDGRRAIAEAARERMRDRAQQRREMREARAEAMREARQARRSTGRWF
jgi:hypothetical protein